MIARMKLLVTRTDNEDDVQCVQGIKYHEMERFMDGEGNVGAERLKFQPFLPTVDTGYLS